MKKIIIAADSFKGSVSSMQMADSVESGIRDVFPDCEVIKHSIADGGEGTIASLKNVMNATRIDLKVHGPLMDSVEAWYGILPDGKSAIMEMAVAAGLPMVPIELYNPLKTTTFGLGEMILDAINRGCRNFMIGIGGSATNDAGLGMLQALGFRFLDSNGKLLGVGGEILNHVSSIDRSLVIPELRDCHFTVACDVNSPFFGKKGAAYVFSPQKGATPDEVKLLDNGLRHLNEVITTCLNKDISKLPGAGAAGGLGGGMVAFLNAELKPGIEIVLQAIRFDESLIGADLVITGEGKLDAQTAMGKAPRGVLDAATKRAVPVIALGGCVKETEALIQQGFLAVYPILPMPVSLEKAMDTNFTCANIKRTVIQILRTIRYFQ